MSKSECSCVCNPGWLSPGCNDCVPGNFGPSCSPCSCVNGQCDDTTSGTGHCKGPACSPGSYGQDCNQECVSCPASLSPGFLCKNLTNGGGCDCEPGFVKQRGQCVQESPCPACSPSEQCLNLSPGGFQCVTNNCGAACESNSSCKTNNGGATCDIGANLIEAFESQGKLEDNIECNCIPGPGPGPCPPTPACPPGPGPGPGPSPACPPTCGPPTPAPGPGFAPGPGSSPEGNKDLAIILGSVAGVIAVGLIVWAALEFSYKGKKGIKGNKGIKGIKGISQVPLRK